MEDMFDSLVKDGQDSDVHESEDLALDVQTQKMMDDLDLDGPKETRIFQKIPLGHALAFGFLAIFCLSAGGIIFSIVGASYATGNPIYIRRLVPILAFALLTPPVAVWALYMIFSRPGFKIGPDGVSILKRKKEEVQIPWSRISTVFTSAQKDMTPEIMGFETSEGIVIQLSIYKVAKKTLKECFRFCIPYANRHGISTRNGANWK